MKKSRRVVSIFLAACLLITLAFAGCAKKTADKGSETKKTEAKKTEAKKTEEKPMNLTWLIGGPGKQKDHDKVIAKANEILQGLVPNTTIEIESIPPADYKQKFDLMMAASETLDIAWSCWTQPIKEDVEKGALLPLNDLIDEHAPDIKAEIPEWLLAGGEVDGDIYMIPKYEMHFWQLAMYSPKDLFEEYFDIEAGKKVFNNHEEFIHVTDGMYNVIEDYLSKLKDADKLGKGFSPWVFGMNSGHDLIGGPPKWSYIMPATARYYTQGNEWDFTVLNTYKREEVIDMFKKFAKWREKGYIREDMLSLQNPREDENTKDGDRYSVWFHNYQNPKETGDYYVEKRWDAENIRFPVQQFSRVNANYNDGLTIPRTAQDPVRSIKVIALNETAAGKEFYNTLTWGIEGEHYKKISDNRIETIGYSGQGNADAAYGQWKWALGNVHNAWVTQMDPVDDYKSYWDKMHKSGFINPLGAFKYSTDNTVNELAQIRSVLSEYCKAFMCGYYTEDKYNEFLEKLDKAGLEKVLADTQEQLDAFLEKQGIPKTGYVMK